MKYIISFLGMSISFIFLPWWGTYVMAVLFLIYTKGYIPLFFMLLLDFYALPQEFPIASASFLGLMTVAYVLKERILSGVE